MRKKRWGTAGGTHVTTLHIRNVPVDVRLQFKAFCARHDYTMEEAAIALLRKCIQDDTKLIRNTKET